MSALDWAVLVGTLAGIVVYGLWRSRRQSAGAYLRGANLSWATIGLSVMATQASAITFLSPPGLAFEEGMGFVQFYFGLPLAVIVVAAIFVPIYYRSGVVTAYEYLERRFDARVRVLGAILFLVGRGLGAGITIYAPAIVLAAILGWSLPVVIVAIGLFVIAYTVSGGTTVVSQTQKHQMVVILLGMIAAGVFLFHDLPAGTSLDDVASLAGAAGRMRIVDTSLRFDTRYTVWSGLAGGFFLQLSYFGTDQSQVQRYLGGQSSAAARLGLLFNGLFKVPMQLAILFVGVLLYVFYVFRPSPVFFDPATLARARAAEPAVVATIERDFDLRVGERREAAARFFEARARGGDVAGTKRRFEAAESAVAETRRAAKTAIERAVPGASTQDGDFVFLTYVLTRLPRGLVGLLIAVILAAAMSSTAGELNALGTTSAIDLVERFRPGKMNDAERARVAMWLTIVWGLVALGFALVAKLFDNLIEAVNVVGSLFYGTILGLFVVGFFFRRIGASAVFWGAVVAQASVVALFVFGKLGFLWYNAIGCAVVLGVAAVLEAAKTRRLRAAHARFAGRERAGEGPSTRHVANVARVSSGRDGRFARRMRRVVTLQHAMRPWRKRRRARGS